MWRKELVERVFDVAVEGDESSKLVVRLLRRGRT
jgi:hypothetical protein